MIHSFVGSWYFQTESGVYYVETLAFLAAGEYQCSEDSSIDEDFLDVRRLTI